MSTTAALHISQKDVYIDQMINRDSPQYNIGGYIKLLGKLNVELFIKAVESAGFALDAFRLRFDLNDSAGHCQILDSGEKLKLSQNDYSSPDLGEKAAQEWMQSRFNAAFEVDLNHDLYEHALLKISDNEYWFYGRYHHLITDGYGFIVFVQYVAREYRKLIGEEVADADYGSYIEEINKSQAYYGSAEHQADSAYWSGKIAEKPLRMLHKRSGLDAVDRVKSTTYIRALTPVTRKAMEDIMTETGCGLQQLTTAALMVYLWHTTGHNEFVIGIPVHKRGSRKLRNIVGMFSGILPFKGAITENLSVDELLKETGRNMRNDYRHQNYPLGELSRDLKVNPLDGYLHEISVNYEPLNFELDFGNNIEAGISRLANEFDRNPLQICWRDYGNKQPLELQIHFKHEYFEQEEIYLLAERLISIIKQFTNKNAGIMEIDVLTGRDRELLTQFNNTDQPFPKDQTVLDLIKIQTDKTPDKVAIQFDNNTSITYRELEVRSNQLAHQLIAFGVTPQSMVPLCVPRSIDMVVCILGIMKTGAAYVPVDPEYPQHRIQYLIEDSGAKIILCGGKSGKKNNCGLETFFNSDKIIIEYDTIGEVLKNQPITAPQIQIKQSDLAYVIYTSGSSGKPKGVLIEHGNLFAFIHWCLSEFAETDFEVVYANTSVCFDLSLFELFYPLAADKQVRILQSGMNISDFVGTDKKVMLNSVPVVIENLLKEGIDLSNVTAINMAGEPIGPYVQEHLDRVNIEVRNLYGPTEDTTYSTNYRLKEGENVLIGKPISNTKVHIINRLGNLQPVGVVGEIALTGAGVTRGYHRNPELSAQKFVSNPFSKNTNSRMYKTGDLGRWLPDGNIEYLGRMDEQVKVRGYRIELGEIETVLQQSGLVEKAVVLAVEEPSGSKRLVGFVIPIAEYSHDAIVDYLRKELPEFMVPTQIIPIAQIPLMPNGKIDRQSLANIEIAEYLNTDYQGPRNDFESKLVEIWKEILKVKRIGIDDNFFELGGHSISALQLNSRIHKKLNIKTEITFILQYPTIRKLSEALLRENSSDFNEILPLPKSDFYPLSHAQKRFWVMSHYKEGSEVYNESSVYTIEKDLNTEAFEHAFVEIIKRHEILRTVFVEVNNEPFQKVLEPEASLFKISHVDLRQNTESEKYIKEWLKKDIKLAFDLSNGPLMRATLFRVEDKKYQFAFNIHHIISDGWSKGLIIKEFLHFYKEITLGFKKQWQPLSIQYKDYAAWQLTTFNKEKQFWKQQFEDQVPVLDFPTDFERPKVLSFFGSTIQVHLSQNLTHSLRHLAIVNNMSVNNLMLALYGMLLSRYTGQKDVVLGTVASGRSHIDLEHLIGAFINFLPIRIKLDEEVKIGQYLSYVNEHLNEAYHNQDYPFDLIVEDVLKQRDISRNPMFDTMINFQLDNDLLSKGEFWENHFDEIGITVTPDQSLQENLFQSVLDMKMDVVPVDKMLHLNLSFNNKLFTETRMQDFLSQYVTLLEQVVDNPDKKLIEYGTWNLLKANNNSVNKQKALAVKVCSSFVMEPISEIFEYWNNELELNLELQFAPYNQIFQQLVDPSSLLNNNEGINVLFVRMEDWLRSKTFADVNAAIEYLQKTYDEFHNLLSAALARVNTHFIIAVLPVLNENRHDARLVNAIAILNTALVNFINSHSRLHRFDLEKMEALYGVENGYDAHSDEAGHMPFTPEYYATLGTFVARAIASYKGNPYKVIVLDCDNTLWHGVTGEAGALNVKINSGYQALQEFVISKYNEGFLLALCSKNNEADVWEVFEKNKSMVLTKEHIAAHRINWNPKADNIREIAKELNLGLSSFIFIDDNEFETEQVSLGCPDVLTLTLPEQPEEFMDYLNHIWEFDVFKITDEDLLRNEMYRTENRRKDELQNFESYDKFIESLEIEVGINPLSNEDLDRALQLTMRTNQFNLNGIRKTEAELLKSMANPKAVNWIIEVRDRFGDYGKVGLVLAHENGTQLKIDTFLLSCRVLGRHVEETILEKLNGYCLINGLQTIVANFIQTEKNIPFSDFLHRTGWELDNSGSAYTLNIKIRDQVNATIK